MFPYEIWSTVRKNLSNPYYISDEFLNWINFKHYPIVRWTQKTLFFGKLSKSFNAASYNKWWLVTSITKQFLYPRGCDEICLTSQEPYIYLIHEIEQHWMLINVKQAGEYISRN